MQSAPGVYRALCVRIMPSEEGVFAQVPQLFGVAEVPVTQATGDFPTPGDQGWVVFEGADPEWPVWLSRVASQ